MACIGNLGIKRTIFLICNFLILLHKCFYIYNPKIKYGKKSHRLFLPDDYDTDLIKAEFRMSREYNPNYSPKEIVLAQEKMIGFGRRISEEQKLTL